MSGIAAITTTHDIAAKVIAFVSKYRNKVQFYCNFIQLLTPSKIAISLYE